MPALQEIPAPVTMIDRFDLETLVESAERSMRCSGAVSVREMRIAICDICGGCGSNLYTLKGSAISEIWVDEMQIKRQRAKCRSGQEKAGLWRPRCFEFTINVVRATIIEPMFGPAKIKTSKNLGSIPNYYFHSPIVRNSVGGLTADRGIFDVVGYGCASACPTTIFQAKGGRAVRAVVQGTDRNGPR